MKRTSLIRLGGLAAMVGGGAWVAGETVLAIGLSKIGISSTSLSQALDILPVGLLTLGAMAAVVALHALQRECYGWQGTLYSLAAFVGLAMFFVYEVLNLMDTVREMDFPLLLDALGTLFLIPGLLVASIGIIGLGVSTIGARVLPWWCGVALIVGSPLVFTVEFALLNSLLWAWWPTAPNQPVSKIGPDTIPWMVLGVPWALVGYAIVRAGACQHEEQPL